MSDELTTLWCGHNIASKRACTSFEITKCSMNWHSLFLAFGCHSIVKILVELNSICGRFMMLWATQWRTWRELSPLTKTEVVVHDLLQFKTFVWPIPNWWQGFIVINCAIHQYYQVELRMWKHAFTGMWATRNLNFLQWVMWSPRIILVQKQKVFDHKLSLKIMKSQSRILTHWISASWQ